MRLIVCIILALAMASPAHAAYNLMAYVPGDQNPTVPVLTLDDPANPYKGQYSELDRWAAKNFNRYINRENQGFFQLSLQQLNTDLKDHGFTGELAIWRSYVEQDKSGTAYMIPMSVYNARLQEKNIGPRKLADMFSPLKTSDSKDEPLSFWSMGIVDQAAFDVYNSGGLIENARWLPPIPDWMIRVATHGDELYLLPDGGVVVNRKASEDLSIRSATLRRYDASGALVKEAEVKDYMTWERVMLNDPLAGSPEGWKPYIRHKDYFEPSGKLAGTASNIASSGRYTAFRDPDNGGFVAVIDYWQGKLLTNDEVQDLTMDPYPYFSPLSYEALMDIYAQQGL
jgi:hypothetical protein